MREATCVPQQCAVVITSLLVTPSHSAAGNMPSYRLLDRHDDAARVDQSMYLVWRLAIAAPASITLPSAGMDNRWFPVPLAERSWRGRQMRAERPSLSGRSG
jgi:hypothetical protein